MLFSSAVFPLTRNLVTTIRMMLIRKTRFTYEAETRKNISNYLGTLEQYFSQFLVLRTGNLEIRRYAPFVIRFYFKKF